MRNIILLQPRRFLKKIYPKAIWHYNRNEANIYLSFDDGPIPGLTEWVLDELLKKNIKATFFCVGDNIIKHPMLFKRILDEGHSVGNHSMYHPKGFKTKTEFYVKEMDECKELVQNKLFRPPYGQLKRSQYKTLIQKGYKIVMWDVISFDFESISPEQCLSNVLRYTKKGSIVLFHDNWKAEANMKFALPLFIEHFLKLGYNFKSIETSKINQPSL